MTVDVHAHLGHWSFPIADLSASDLVSQMDRWKIDKTIISSSRAVRYDFITGNKELAMVLHAEERLFGYITVNLHYPEESLAQIRTYGTDNPEGRARRFVGVKIHPMIQQKRFDTNAGFRIAEAAFMADLPILIHTFGSERETPLQVLPVLRRFPNLKIILAHAGGFDWYLANEIANAGSHVYAEICSSCTTGDKLLQLIGNFGDDRVLFGTDTTLFHPGYALGMVEEAIPDASSRSRLMGDNAQELFRLP